MIISFSRRFIFVHPPKTAGESVTMSLVPFLSPEDVVLCEPRWEQSKPHVPGNSCHKHSTLSQIRAAYSDTVKGFFSFGFARNPWDRSVSFYKYLQSKNFSKHADAGPPYYPCWHWTEDLDFVGRFETLEEDFGRVCRSLGIDARLVRINATRHGAYREYYDETTRERIRERNTDDLREYGYEY